MIQYNLPNIQKTLLYARLAEAIKFDSDAFYDDFKIGSVFGNFPSCIWDGGCVDLYPSWNAKIIEQTAQLYDDLDIPMCLTFTNPLIDKEHLNDTYANLIANICQSDKNQILVCSPVLEDYLREKYPQYSYGRSILASEKKPYDASDKYCKTVMQRSKNNDWAYLDTIPEKDRSKIEFLCNDPCPDNCPFIYSHYLKYASYQLSLGNDTDPNDCAMNGIIGANRNHYTQGLKSHISHDMIVNEYIPKGFTNFKLSGRSGDILVPTMGILQYLTKPDYQMDIMYVLLSE